MAPPKPSQRGKFRPKKPPKKASKPAAATATTGAATSSSLPSIKSTNPGEGSIPRRNDSTIEASAGRGRGRGRGGRGRGGRGRGRIPIPQGTVFFTGGEKKTAASAKGSTAKRTTISAGASRSSRKSDDSAAKGGRDSIDTSTEEVVGQLDTAIGGSGNTKKESVLERDYGDYVDEEPPVASVMNLNISANCMYDSDSSDEGSTRKSKTISLIAPLELPFATRSLSERVEPDVTNSTHIDEHNFDDYAAQPASPFVANNNTYGIHEENNSWFLVQLPTRLPPMQKNVSRQENDNDDAEGEEGANRNTAMDSTASSANDNTMNNLSEVAVPPVTTSCFDHGLDKNAPGKIGKILVYKSGKTVLVLDSPDDKLTMDVNEGLRCRFHQQVVTVNTKEGHYINLGDVDKSIVISPDLTSI